jgi:hypothetical protein
MALLTARTSARVCDTAMARNSGFKDRDLSRFTKMGIDDRAYETTD